LAAPRVGVGLHHERRHRSDQYGFGHAALPVSGDVVHDFAAAGGVSNVDGVRDTEMGSQGSEVVGVVVHVVTVAGLRGALVPTPVMGDDAVALPEEEQHFGVPVVGRKRPAVAENDRVGPSPSPCRRSLCHPRP
jgi:hypothetical protein